MVWWSIFLRPILQQSLPLQQLPRQHIRPHRQQDLQHGPQQPRQDESFSVAIEKEWSLVRNSSTCLDKCRQLSSTTTSNKCSANAASRWKDAAKCCKENENRFISGDLSVFVAAFGSFAIISLGHGFLVRWIAPFASCHDSRQFFIFLAFNETNPSTKHRFESPNQLTIYHGAVELKTALSLSSFSLILFRCVLASL